MRAVWQAIAFFFIVVLIFLVYTLPAKFVYQQVAADIPVKLLGVSGSIWSGHAQQIQLQQISLEKIDWQLSPLALLTGDASIQWQLNDPAVSLGGELVLSSDLIALTNTHGSIDLLAMQQFFPQQDILLAGTITVNIDRVFLDQEKFLDAAGTINWQQAALLAPQNIPFGDFKAKLLNDTGQLNIQLSDLEGAISLSGMASMTRYGAFQYVLKLGVRDTSVPGLLEGFNQLGQPDASGKVTISDSLLIQ